ncbi:hypothetical protein OOJ91_34090 [Micromonospora lupini]|uniref:hypothetical protein n=1 Tax=Micromonospora lupini TaxID=285679 RepID=UPI002258CB5F|nr:hypothetical protein [Micromonospora lupini]MCX5070880.1 hypothetical protein [Micromonospora lupini]
MGVNMTLANPIIGPDRREHLIRAAADRLILEQGLAPDAALRYATAAYDNGDPIVLVAVGQVWRAKRQPREEADAPRNEAVIAEVDRETAMALTTSGWSLHYGCYLGRHYDLVDWPAEHPAVAEYLAEQSAKLQTAQAEAETEPAAAADDEDEEDPLADGQLYLIVERRRPRDSDRPGVFNRHLPMLSDGYLVHLGNDGKTPFTFLDVPTYLRLHLHDYRDRWPEWYATSWKANNGNLGILGYFNDISGECDLDDTAICAYLGWWLWQRVREDAAGEHGGTAEEYHALFQWGPASANHVVPLVQGADPTQELPADHPLNQCAGQVDLFGLPPTA